MCLLECCWHVDQVQTAISIRSAGGVLFEFGECLVPLRELERRRVNDALGNVSFCEASDSAPGFRWKVGVFAPALLPKLFKGRVNFGLSGDVVVLV